MDKIVYDTDGFHELLEHTRDVFGDHLVSSRVGQELVLIARYPRNPVNGDGQDVDVYCAAMPAEFFQIHALPGNGKPEFTLSTGSGMEKLVAEIAEAISEGMLGM